MYCVEVREHIMIAHSFRGDLFGPAQRLHGATFVVDARFCRSTLGPEGVVVDIGRACDVLKETLAPLAYRNLDEMSEFAGQQTTTEFLAGWIHGKLASAARAGALGSGSTEIERIKIILHESHIARASFAGPV